MRLNDERRSSRDNSLWLLPDCCKALHKLENLTLDCFELDEVWEKLLACAFPNLVRCRLWACGLGPWSYVSAGAMIVSFLIRHPGLKSVWIQFEVPDFEAWPSISMPNVEHLRAPASFLSSVTDHRLKEVWIDWLSDEVQPVELPPASETLKSLTRTDVPLVLCIDCSDDRVAEIMYAASRQIPHTRTLQMGLSNDHYDTWAFINESPLAPFTSLAFLSYSHSEIVIIGDDEAAVLISALVDRCPMLQAVRFNENAWKKVEGAPWDNISVDEFLVLAGISLTSLVISV